jgi:regulator of protease activity HflC (stomatin/prohibitin superfamily)
MNAMVQVAALRDTLYKMGPRFQDAFERRLAAEQAAIAPDIQKAELAYDAIIRAVNGV